MEYVNRSVFTGDYSEVYQRASPFPHIVLHNLWNEKFLASVAAETKKFDDFDGEKKFYGSTGKKFCGTMEKLPNKTRSLIDFAHSPEFLRMLETMTGEQNLVPDQGLEGGGLHSILPGGYLKVHADFNWNSRLKLYRRLNMLVYLNSNWKEQWGGELELWDKDMSSVVSRIFPTINTTVVFTTDDTSFHGHPNPLKCPPDQTRDSIALYFYNAQRPEDEARPQREISIYRPRTNRDLRLRIGEVSRKLKAIGSKNTI